MAATLKKAITETGMIFCNYIHTLGWKMNWPMTGVNFQTFCLYPWPSSVNWWQFTAQGVRQARSVTSKECDKQGVWQARSVTSKECDKQGVWQAGRGHVCTYVQIRSFYVHSSLEEKIILLKRAWIKPKHLIPDISLFSSQLSTPKFKRTHRDTLSM